MLRKTAFSALLLAGMSLAVTGCRSSESGSRPETVAGGESTAAAEDRPKIVALGDSITAGYGIGLERAYPALLQERLDAEGYTFEVVNAGVPGDTFAGGLNRLDWVLDGNVRILIVALGGNDGLRGLPPSAMKRNLSAIIERAAERRIPVLLAGMEAPPNLGDEYTSQFREVFQGLADEYALVFFPFLLQDVGGVASLNQRDGIHPNAEGARVIADHIWTYLQPMLEAASAQ